MNKTKQKPSVATPKVGLISLGCPKNLVDSEVMLGLLHEGGYELTKDESLADVMIVNTCAFIEDSKVESIDTILDVARLKKDGRLKKLIVTGCLSQRYKNELENEMPEVDHFIGTGEFHRIRDFVATENSSDGIRFLPMAKSAVAKPEWVYDYATPRISTLPKHTAHVKIAEGCSRTCSFCIIPQLRGSGRSRSIESVIAEVNQTVKAGAKEINLIAQDLTAYGIDRKDGTSLEALLEKMVEIPDLQWIRLMYNYPMYFTDRLIDLISGSEKICKYIDMPLQHIDSGLLASMRRNVDENATRELLAKLRQRIPHLQLRTTLIVGFPGETDQQFQNLVDFVRETEFDHLGVFTYSQEEGTKAAKMLGQIPDHVKESRRNEIMTVQQEISSRKQAQLVGKELKVLIDRPLRNPNGFTHAARFEGQAIDIDGFVYLRGKSLEVGEFARARVVDSAEYDLFAEAV